MAAKAILVFCAHALFVQVALGQCFGRAAPALAAPARSCGASAIAAPALAAPAYTAPACGYSAPAINVIPTSGGGLPISSVSSIAPSGLAVSSENAYEGILSVVGELPFLSAVALEGVLPSAGFGGVNHACGNGITAIISEGLGAGYGPAAGALAPARAAYAPGAAGIASAAALAPAAGALAPAAGGLGCGCGGLGRGYY